MIVTKDSTKYSTALTGEPFLFNETRTISRYLVQGEDIKALQKRNLAENLIMHKKSGSLKRASTPIFRRLSTMTPSARQLLTEGDLDTAKILLLISVSKTDRLIRDFLFQVYADKLAIKSEKLLKSDVERFFESVYVVEPNLRDRSEQTKAKLKQQMMKIVAEAGLVQRQGVNFLMTRPNLSNKLMNQLVADGDTAYIKVLGGSE